MAYWLLRQYRSRGARGGMRALTIIKTGISMSEIETKGPAARRAFLKKAGTAAAAVPAAAVLLSVAHKSALAQSQSGGVTTPPPS